MIQRRASTETPATPISQSIERGIAGSAELDAATRPYRAFGGQAKANLEAPGYGE